MRVTAAAVFTIKRLKGATAVCEHASIVSHEFGTAIGAARFFVCVFVFCTLDFFSLQRERERERERERQTDVSATDPWHNTDCC